MTGLEDRERQFEQEFAHNEELRFKTRARRNKLVGLWVAAQMGLSGEEAEQYALSLVSADLQEPGDQDVIRKILADLKARGIEMDPHRIERELARCMDEARRQIMEETRS